MIVYLRIAFFVCVICVIRVLEVDRLSFESGQCYAMSEMAREDIHFALTNLKEQTAPAVYKLVAKHLEQASQAMELIIRGSYCNPDNCSSTGTLVNKPMAKAKGTSIVKNSAKANSPTVKGLQIKLVSNGVVILLVWCGSVGPLCLVMM